VFLLAWAATAQAGLLTGRAPATTGLLLVFDAATGPPPAYERYFRVPEYTAPVGEDATFRITLPAGRYYLGLYRSATGAPPPPRTGDTLCRFEDIAGDPAVFTVPEDGTVEVRMVPACATFRFPSLDTILTAATDPARLPPDVTVGQVYTGIAGTVADGDGNPVAGVLVFARDTNRGARFVSRPSDALGRYVVLTDRGGTYHLQAAGGAFATAEPVSVDTDAITSGIELTPAVRAGNP